MPKFDYEYAKGEITQINRMVETCPEAVKEKCFELLFGMVFGSIPPVVPLQAELIPPQGSRINLLTHFNRRKLRNYHLMFWRFHVSIILMKKSLAGFLCWITSLFFPYISYRPQPRTHNYIR